MDVRASLEKNREEISRIVGGAHARVRERVAALNDKDHEEDRSGGEKTTPAITTIEPPAIHVMTEPAVAMKSADTEPAVSGDTDIRAVKVSRDKKKKRSPKVKKIEEEEGEEERKEKPFLRMRKGQDKSLVAVRRRIAKKADKIIAQTPSDEELVEETAEDILLKEQRRAQWRERQKQERLTNINETIQTTPSDEEREVRREEKTKDILERARADYFDAKDAYEKIRARNASARTGLRNVFSRVFPLGEADREERELKKISEEKKRAYDALMGAEESHERSLGAGRGEAKKHVELQTLDQQIARFGLKAEECMSIEGFGVLSEGQKRLVFENLAALTIGKIDEQARGSYQKQKMSGMEMSDKKKPLTSFAEKMWRGFREAFTKDLAIANVRKTTAREIMSGGLAEHGDALRALVAIARKGPDVRTAEDGALQMEFVRADAVAQDKEGSALRFNDAARAFANMPRIWSTETATKKQQDEYARAQNLYETAKEDLLRARAEQCGDNARAMAWMASVESAVYMQQFFATQREASAQLERTVGAPVIVQSWKEIAKSAGEYLGYAALGFASRMVLAGGIGFAAAPVSAAAVAALRTRFRVQKELRERDLLAQQGQRDSGEMAKNIVDAKNLAARLESVLSRMRDLPTMEFSTEEEREAERDRLLSSLATRVDFTNMKMTQARVNYGTATERTANQYTLVRAIAQAQALLEILSAPEKNEKTGKRLDRFLAHKEQNIWAARQWYRNAEQFHAVSRAAAFGALGASARWIGEELGWWGTTQSSARTLPGETQGVLEKNMPPENLPLFSDENAQQASVDNVTTQDFDGASVQQEDAPPESAQKQTEEQKSLDTPAPHETGASPEQEIAQQAENTPAQPLPIELTIQKGSSFEGTLIRHFTEQGMDIEEAGRQAHRMALRFAAEHNLPGAPRIVHHGDTLTIVADPDVQGTFMVKEFHAEKPSDVTPSHDDAQQVQATIGAVRALRQEFYGAAQTPFANVRVLPATDMMDAAYFHPRLDVLQRFLGEDALPRSEETVERYTQRVGRLSVRQHVTGDILKALKGI